MSSLFLENYSSFLIPILMLLGTSFIYTSILYKRISYIGFLFYSIGWIMFYVTVKPEKKTLFAIAGLIPYFAYVSMALCLIYRNKHSYHYSSYIYMIGWILIFVSLVDEVVSRLTQYLFFSIFLINFSILYLLGRQRKKGYLYDVSLGLYSSSWVILCLVGIEKDD